MNNKKIHGVFKITPITPIHISDGEKYQIFEYYIDDKKIFYLKDVMKYFQDNCEDYNTALKIIEDLSFHPGPEYIRYTLPVYAESEKAKKTTSVAQPKSPTATAYLSTKQTKIDPHIAKIMKQAEKQQAQSHKNQIPSSQSTHQYQPTEEVFAFIKDPFGQPFIPGSSLKGCIRTAIIFSILSNEPSLPDTILKEFFQKQKDNNKVKFQEILNNYIFPKNDIKYDLFKALVIRDSSPFQIMKNQDTLPTLNDFAVCQIQIAKKTTKGLEFQGGIILAECLYTNTKSPIEIPFYIDKFTIEKLVESPTPKSAIEKLQSTLSNPEKLKNALLNFSNKLIESQEEFYKSSGKTNPLQKNFQEAREKKEILLQLGFGTGYLSKTIALAYPPETRAEIQKKLHLGKAKNYTQDIPFPRSRRLITDKTSQTPTLPMGWFKLELDWK